MKAFHNNFRDSSHNKQKLIFMLQFAVLNILVFVMNTLSPVFSFYWLLNIYFFFVEEGDNT